MNLGNAYQPSLKKKEGFLHPTETDKKSTSLAHHHE
jgi:hypothetical protein